MATVKAGVKKQVYKQIAPVEKISASKAAKKTDAPVVKVPAKTAEKPELKVPVKTDTKTKVKAKASSKSAATSDKKPAAPKAAKIEKAPEKVTGHIVYQPSSEILERAAQPNEMFGIGDAMPIYYL